MNMCAFFVRNFSFLYFYIIQEPSLFGKPLDPTHQQYHLHLSFGSPQDNHTQNLSSITHFISIKLDNTYLNWVSQFLPVLRSHELMGIVDGNKLCPPRFQVDESGKITTILNPDYTLWQNKGSTPSELVQHQSLWECIILSIWFKHLQTGVELIGCTLCFTIKIHNSIFEMPTLISKSRSRSCSKNLSQVKAFADQFTMPRKFIKYDDLKSYIVGGLNLAYTSFITSFNFATCESTISSKDFQAELLNYVILLDNHQQQSQSSDPSTFALYTKTCKFQ